MALHLNSEFWGVVQQEFARVLTGAGTVILMSVRLDPLVCAGEFTATR